MTVGAQIPKHNLLSVISRLCPTLEIHEIGKRQVNELCFDRLGLRLSVGTIKAGSR